MIESPLVIRDLEVDLKSDFFAKPSRILHKISFEVPQGQIYGFLGPNGSGKTTTIKTVLGLIPRFDGSIRVLGQDPGSQGVRKLIGFAPENAYFSDYLTPADVVRSMGTLSGLSTTEIWNSAEVWFERLKLDHVVKKPVRAFSKGMKQRLNLIQALLHDPEFVILDEPTTGLDPIGRKEIKNLVMQLKEKGKTVLVCTHNLLEAEEFCDQICIINQGEVVKQGTLTETLLDGKNLEETFIEYVQGREVS